VGGWKGGSYSDSYSNFKLSNDVAYRWTVGLVEVGGKRGGFSERI